MVRWLALSLLLLVRHASADVVHFRSTGRAVTIEVDQQSCTTPCALDLAGGEQHARIDGLDRWITPSAELVITPTRYRRLGLAIALLTLGVTGLSLAGHWSSPLTNEGRLAAGLGGAALMGISIPVIFASSAKLGRPPESRTDLYVAYHGDLGPMLALGVGYRPHAVGLGVQVRGRFATAVSDRYQLAIGPTFHGPRIAYLRPVVALAVGFAELRGADTPANIPMETPAKRGELGLRATAEIEGRIELDVPLPITPSIGMTARTYPDQVYALDAGVHVAF
jgi:hypothetical protein